MVTTRMSVGGGGVERDSQLGTWLRQVLDEGTTPFHTRTPPG